MNRPLYKIRLAVITVVFFLVFQAIYSLSVRESYLAKQSSEITALTERVILDLPSLPLPAHQLKIVGNRELVADYVRELNKEIKRRGSWSISLVSVNVVVSQEDMTKTPSYQHVRLIKIDDRTIQIRAIVKPFIWKKTLSLFPLVACLIMAWLCFPYIDSFRRRVPLSIIEEAKQIIWMTVDLEKKCLVNQITGEEVALSNKPFCFYAALLEYCMQPDIPVLSPNRDIPDDLIRLANKYYFRLIELGHTIRKRPDFNSNLDKVLSEIRAALDELYLDMPEVKVMFYPPKAVGEGSRSKNHNYALNHLDPNVLTVLGK